MAQADGRDTPGGRRFCWPVNGVSAWGGAGNDFVQKVGTTFCKWTKPQLTASRRMNTESSFIAVVYMISYLIMVRGNRP